jgi:hypothetical protein
VKSSATELLSRLREIAKKEIIGAVNADTAVGRAVETALGIQINSSRSPDFMGIELKAHRSQRASDRFNLFAKVPDWTISSIKSSRGILDRFGYTRGGETKLYCTVSSRTPNSQGLVLSLSEGRLEENFRNIQQQDEPVCVWRLPTLHASLNEKHRETFWIKVKSMKGNGREAFQLVSATHTSRPSTFNFDAMLNTGEITVDHLIKRKVGQVGANEKGPLFKIDELKRDQLFLGQKCEYRLI